MAATTITANPADTAESVSLSAGGTPGARGVTLIIDWTKVGSLIELDATIEKIRMRIRRQGGVPPAS